MPASVYRPDAEIFADVRHALDARPDIPATVRVHVDHAVAVLTGSVRSVAQASEAADVVRAVAGVTHVINEIAVSEAPNPAGLEPPDDRG